ncbi:MAG: hypothetical protein GKR95_05315 [Gammaproteobacteria bacterium]|nr:hypothetical protein [Gammaproteobacteria bacterium]
MNAKIDAKFLRIVFYALFLCINFYALLYALHRYTFDMGERYSLDLDNVQILTFLEAAYPNVIQNNIDYALTHSSFDLGKSATGVGF